MQVMFKQITNDAVHKFMEKNRQEVGIGNKVSDLLKIKNEEIERAKGLVNLSEI